MAITRTAQVDDDGSGTSGTIYNNAWKTELYNQIDAVVSDGPNWVTHNAANYTADAPMTWTVGAANQTQNYVLTVGKLVVWNVVLTSCLLGGSPSAKLKIAWPPGVTFMTQGGVTTPVRLLDGNGAILRGIIFIEGTNLILAREDFANFTLGGSNGVWFTFVGFRT